MNELLAATRPFAEVLHVINAVIRASINHILVRFFPTQIEQLDLSLALGTVTANSCLIGNPREKNIAWLVLAFPADKYAPLNRLLKRPAKARR
ncbi:hypothetical protein [Luteimonas vadosa]|uniref:hypothetical protein n=1 Tax=Luteimonas vadosa TaxID=1165507 RepID=UPI0031EB74BE